MSRILILTTTEARCECGYTVDFTFGPAFSMGELLTMPPCARCHPRLFARWQREHLNPGSVPADNG